MVITESLLILGPLKMTVVVVVDEVVLEVVELVVAGVGLVVAVGEETWVVAASPPPHAAATRANARVRRLVRVMGREDKSA